MIRMKKDRKIAYAAGLFIGLSLMAACVLTPQPTCRIDATPDVGWISPQDAYAQVAAGKALLVCAYADENVCSTIMLEGAISLKEFESRLAGLAKDQPIIFYCS